MLGGISLRLSTPGKFFSPAFVSAFCGIFQAPADEDVCRIRHVTLETIRSKAACLSCQLKQGVVQYLSYSYNFTTLLP
jgi:hypothetical protein